MTRSRFLIATILAVVISWGSVAAALAVGWTPRLGLDLQGGFAVVLAAPEGIEPEVLDKAVEIMRRRIENLGSVQEPEISVQGDRAILVQLPGVTDRERALAAVGTTGQLTFRPVLAAGSIPTIHPWVEFGLATISEEGTLVPGEGFVIPEGIDPATGLSLVDDSETETWLLSEDGFIFNLGAAFLGGADITGAEPGFQGGGISGGWVVDPAFTDEGGAKFQSATAELSQFPVGDPRRRLAIVVDGVVFSAPTIAENVGFGEGLDPDNVFITIGTPENAEAEARDLATILQYGALPTVFERERVESVSATLGSDSLQAGLIAGIGGLLLVAAALIFYYRALGIVAILGLSVFGSLLILIVSLLGRFQGTTLTLAGVAGIIVSIGITSDSYIVYFERIKEEIHHGKPVRSAVDKGFARAFRTVLTGDTVTFAGSILLWILAIGPVKGFAITLGIATVIDVAVAYYFTRNAVGFLSRTRLAEHGVLSIKRAAGRFEEDAQAALA